jgi:peptidoglycan/LPS O-acetylase OafA/YrhL
LFSYFGHYGVQIFIFISGVGLAYQWLNKPQRYGSFIIQRTKKLYFMLIVGLVFFYFMKIIVFQTPMSICEWNAMLCKFLFLQTLFPNQIFSLNGVWWFFALIFQLYLWFPFLWKMIRKYSFMALLVICVFSYICVFLEHYVFPLPEGIMFMANSIAHLPEFALGIYIALHPNKNIHPLVFLGAAVIFILGNFNWSFYPFTFLSVTLLFFALFSKINFCKNQSNNIFDKMIQHLGKLSMSLFIVHGFLRSPFIDVFYETWYTKLLGAFFFFITVYGISLIADIFYHKILRCFNKTK